MFRKFFIAFAGVAAAGYCFAAENYPPQVVTGEVFYTTDANTVVYEDDIVRYDAAAWPVPGTDADMTVSCAGSKCDKNSDNIRIVSKIGDDIVVQNEFNVGESRRSPTGEGWSGGADMLHGNQVPAGFDNECDSRAEMPLLRREMLEDDGGEVLAVSISARKKCGKPTMLPIVIDEPVPESEIAVDTSADAVAKMPSDMVRSWVVASGQTLRDVLQQWCDKEGWDLVWATPREYPIEASAVFKGRFVDVASALVRNFGRATPVPYAKFYNGNRVLVISTTEE